MKSITLNVQSILQPYSRMRVSRTILLRVGIWLQDRRWSSRL